MANIAKPKVIKNVFEFPKKKNVASEYTFSNENNGIHLRQFKENVKDEIIDYHFTGTSDTKPYDHRIYIDTFEEYSMIINASIHEKFIVDTMIFPRQAVRFENYTNEIKYVVYDDGTDELIGLPSGNIKLILEKSDGTKDMALCYGDYTDAYLDKSASPTVTKIDTAQIIICCKMASELFKELDEWFKSCSGMSLIERYQNK